MFTGLIEELGTVRSLRRGGECAVLTVQAERIFDDLKLGDSVAVNGVCLTVSALEQRVFFADVMHETLNRSSLGSLIPGSHVNLERAMSAGGRFGGHIVSGHIDGTGKLLRIRRDGNAVWYTVSAEPKILRYIMEKGSVAIDGLSLTVASMGREDFSVSIIPHTAQETTLSERRVGDTVNLENDAIAKYVEKWMQPCRPAGTGITPAFLAESGF